MKRHEDSSHCIHAGYDLDKAYSSDRPMQALCLRQARQDDQLSGEEMSRTNPGHAFETNERKALTAQQKAKLFLERGGRCFQCKRKLGPGDKWTDEHVVALENGGTNEWSNRDVCCSWCFKPKNAADDKTAAKTRAVATKHVVPKSEQKSKSPPIPGSKRSPWKRKMNGELVRR